MIQVIGGKELQGEVVISGSKNAALPILAASLLIQGKITLHNVPDIADVRTFLDILSGVGVLIEKDGHTITLDTLHLQEQWLDLDKMKKIRASILLISPLLHHFWTIDIPFPGGCKLGARPIDTHLQGLKEIGYQTTVTPDSIEISGEKETGDIILNGGFWVTATENLIVANVLRQGTTTIKNAAIEPHVMNLIDMLRSAGADIKIRYDHSIIITGVETLETNVEATIIPDYIEAGTFMIIGALAAKEYIDIHHAAISDLYSFISCLQQAGVKVEEKDTDILRVYRAKKLLPTSIQTNIFPGFPTDLQSPLSVLMTQAEGTGRIHEVLFEGRLNFLWELENLGAHVAILNPHEALVFWPTPLRGGTVTSWDLRAGVAMIIAGLISTDTVKITNVEYIHRGYENIISKLQNLGADIKEI